MHGGKCQDFGSGLNCSCSADFTGVGCQYEFDACQANVCQNGATCVDNGAGYNCVCPPGFTGKNCDEDVINCRENSCPPTATCIDLTDRFYCQCPFNLTGDDCRKSKYPTVNWFIKLACYFFQINFFVNSIHVNFEEEMWKYDD